MIVEARARLPVKPEEVWRRLLMWERQSEWMVDAAWVRVLGHWREGVGTRVAVRTRILGIPVFTEILEVTSWEPPRRLAMAHRGFVQGSGEWSLEPSGGGTILRWTEELRLPLPILGELSLLAYRPIMRRLMRRSLINFEGLLRP